VGAFTWELDRALFREDLTRALYILFGVNFIDTRLLMVFVVPAYLAVGFLQVFFEKNHSEDPSEIKLEYHMAYLVLNGTTIFFLNYVQ